MKTFNFMGNSIGKVLFLTICLCSCGPTEPTEAQIKAYEAEREKEYQLREDKRLRVEGKFREMDSIELHAVLVECKDNMREYFVERSNVGIVHHISENSGMEKYFSGYNKKSVLEADYIRVEKVNKGHELNTEYAFLLLQDSFDGVSKEARTLRCSYDELADGTPIINSPLSVERSLAFRKVMSNL
jgi:hypothetical protein